MKHKILHLLRDNARLSAAQIARRIGAPKSEVAAVIKELERSRTIVAYKAIINPELVDEQTVEAVIEVKVRPKRGTGFDDIARRIYNFPEVHSLYLISGGMDFLVFLEAKSMKDIAHFVTEKLATLEDVQSTGTHFALKKYKKDGVVLHEAESASRLAVTP
ncbi:MAG: Lrp/AsnC family transcriptional regulator [bacterium]|nr:Lrp/AsnC family transcriptional regulator [Candidatus Sumerlaeota bacterium]